MEPRRDTPKCPWRDSHPTPRAGPLLPTPAAPAPALHQTLPTTAAVVTAATAATLAPPLPAPAPRAPASSLPSQPMPLGPAPCRAPPRGACLASGLSLDAHELLAGVQDLEELGSHTELPRLDRGASLHGNWAVTGPAVVRRVGRALRVQLRAGAWVALGASLEHVVTAESAAPRGAGGPGPGGAAAGPAAATTAFELHGTLVELSGPFKMLLPGPGTQEHPDGGRMVVTVPKLQEEQCILLLPGGCISHPVCAVPRRAARSAAGSPGAPRCTAPG
jgi:hypothetical protein